MTKDEVIRKETWPNRLRGGVANVLESKGTQRFFDGLLDVGQDLLENLTFVIAILFIMAMVMIATAASLYYGIENIIASQLATICQQTGNCDFRFLLTAYGVAQFTMFAIVITIAKLISEFTDLDPSMDDVMDTLDEIYGAVESRHIEQRISELEARLESAERKV